jgi:hypothetical protein
MKTSRNPSSSRTLQVNIVDVVPRKEGGCTVIVQAASEIPSEDVWRTGISREYQGAMKVGHLWHVYYGQVPTHTPGAWVEIPLPDESKSQPDYFEKSGGGPDL